jgi:hypothetical protein
MVNEGVISSDSKVLVKSEMLRQIWKLQRTTPDEWEQAVFAALTGGTRKDVDWDFEDNQAGYYTWVKAFDALIEELVDDGYVKVVEGADKTRTLVATEVDPEMDVSRITYPSK